MRPTHRLVMAAMFAIATLISNVAHAAITTYIDRGAWQAAAGASTNIDFATQDDGSSIAPTGTQIAIEAVTLRGVTFSTYLWYDNENVVDNRFQGVQASLPSQTVAIGFDIPERYGYVGAPIAITVISGGTTEVLNTTLSQAGVSFIGITSTGPIESVNVRNTASRWSAIDNFSFVTRPSALQVGIDVLPGAPKNRIMPSLNVYLPVSILSSATFNAADVDVASVRFGVKGTEVSSHGQLVWDTNLDGKRDLVLFFRSKDAGIVCGTTSVILTGQTKTGQKIQGADTIATIGCGGRPTANDIPDPAIFKPPF